MKDLLLIFFVWLAAINLYGFIICGIDKLKAKHNMYRISEKHLFIICFIGGAFGILLGMNTFRHKTKHLKFTIGVPVLCVLWALILAFLLYTYFFSL